MQSKEEIFEDWYCEKGFPELPNADFASIKAAFIQGWAFGRAEALADQKQKQKELPLPLPGPWKPLVPLPGDKPRYRVGKVSPDDPRPVTEPQLRFLHKLINKRLFTTWQTETVMSVTPMHIHKLLSVLPNLTEGLFDLKTLTMGQASALIDLLSKKS
jgi:hypothetical protein